ncbi:hypothetical protein, variant [Exophiala oligosperma]|uniref:Uncharacterized protein n=1 Tax=Exophiala oligosperma TaxID=215243 RepID=A0A0D2A800_9EURO|nr:uncharacterized protein PV06_11329 [Exophiala oligosperma]XP_016256657.1 hypothetical protein, variant [Exophiala oligosperma]KIW36440.1 hypothetical protein PV06_11329 [Exophiala oligosperma]KIW36441.1 hypothetical protein, variant [Exophiala oligosperma]
MQLVKENLIKSFNSHPFCYFQRQLHCPSSLPSHAIMDSEPPVKDFASCVSCDSIIMIARPRRSDRGKKRLVNPIYQITVCYTCERNGAAVPPRKSNEFFSEQPPFYCLSTSLVRNSANFIATGKMQEVGISLREEGGRVIMTHRSDILHSYDPGCRMTTIHVNKDLETTTNESSSLETGFF